MKIIKCSNVNELSEKLYEAHTRTTLSTIHGAIFFSAPYRYLFSSIIKKLSVFIYLALPDDYPDGGIAFGSSDVDISRGDLKDAYRFNSLTGDPDISDLLDDIEAPDRFFNIDGSGLKRVIKFLVTYYIFVSKGTFAQIELARSKWEYRGEHSYSYNIAFSFPDFKIYKI